MFFSIIQSGDVTQIILNLLLTVPVILIALSFHEIAHALTARMLGDKSVKVTLNPFKNLDAIGCIWMFFLGYGWARPAKIDARSFKDPSKSLALIAIAGPIANLLLGTVGAVSFALTVQLEKSLITLQGSLTSLDPVHILKLFFYFLAMINFINAVFNLLPIPPFDGSKSLRMFTPQRVYLKLMKYDKYTLVAVTVISFLSFRFFKTSPAVWVSESLFDVITGAVSAIIDTLSPA